MTRTRNTSPKSTRAFTLVELLVIIALVALVISLTFPALAHAHIKTAGAQCLSNYRRLQLGWEFYREDHNDYLMPNAPAGAGSNNWLSSILTESWNPALANTNLASYTNALIWPYLGDVSLLRCPADILPSANGFRLRSTSMNGQVGFISGNQNYNPPFQTFSKGSDISCVSPSGLYIFLDENMYSLNDGFFQPSLISPEYADVPANYHAGGCGFSFADGHAIIQFWKYSSLLKVPYSTGLTGIYVTTTAFDPDWLWLRSHNGCNISSGL